VFYMSTRRSYIWCLVAADLLSSLACGPKVMSMEARLVPEESACKPSHNNKKVDSEVLFFMNIRNTLKETGEGKST